jgi:transcriptional regulator with XRE-family HTH domain
MTWFVPEFSNPHPTGDDLRQLRQHTGRTIRDLASLCGVTTRTWARWECKALAPIAPYRLAMACAAWVPDPAWAGWSVGQGRLWSPEDVSFTPGDLRSLPYLRASIAELRRLLPPSEPPCPFPPWYGAGI